MLLALETRLSSSIPSINVTQRVYPLPSDKRVPVIGEGWSDAEKLLCNAYGLWVSSVSHTSQ